MSLPCSAFRTRFRLTTASWISVLLLLWTSTLNAQIARTEHVFALEDGAEPPSASLADIAWFAGAWQGEAFGGTFEEVWTAPSHGSMLGMFKLVTDGIPSIYEIQTLEEENGTLVWKVKHFGTDFSAWEDKTEFVSFPLVKVGPNAVYFDGLTLIRESEGITGYILLSGKGTANEQKLTYRPMALGSE